MSRRGLCQPLKFSRKLLRYSNRGGDEFDGATSSLLFCRCIQNGGSLTLRCFLYLKMCFSQRLFVSGNPETDVGFESFHVCSRFILNSQIAIHVQNSCLLVWFVKRCLFTSSVNRAPLSPNGIRTGHAKKLTKMFAGMKMLTLHVCSSLLRHLSWFSSVNSIEQLFPKSRLFQTRIGLIETTWVRPAF